MIGSKQNQQNRDKIKAKDTKLNNKQHYLYNSKLYELTNMPTVPNSSTITPSQAISNTSFDQKLGVTRAKDPVVQAIVNADSHADEARMSSFSAEKTDNRSTSDLRKSVLSTSKKLLVKDKDRQKNAKEAKDLKELVKFPPIRKLSNPQEIGVAFKSEDIFYQGKVERGFRLKENIYMMNLVRQHFLQSVEAIKIGNNLKLPDPKVLVLPRKNPKFKTIFLDLDETLIHCDEASNNYTVKLNFPVEGGAIISAGIRVRPFCQEFIEELSTFAEIIIFTASSPSYADVVLDYLDPKKKYFSHRLYRQHCTLQRGFYTKDLRIVNRRPQDVAIVDNSAFSFMCQPEFGIPILPFYHFAKDRELPSLLKYLKELVEYADMRQRIKKTFFWEKYAGGEEDPRSVFEKSYPNIS